MEVSEITFKIRYDVLHDILCFTVTVLIYNNPNIKFPKHLNEERKRLRVGVGMNEAVRERQSIRIYITRKHETLLRHMILGTVRSSF